MGSASSNYIALPRSVSSPPATRRAAAPARSSPAREPAPWLSRLPWWAVVITLLVLVTALAAVPPAQDAVTGGALPEAHLTIPSGYLAIAPLSNVLDTITLLTVPQHIALLLTVIVLFVAWRVVRPRVRGTERTTERASVVREVIAFAILIGALVIVYAAAAVLPRPMAQLEVTDATVLAVDFHSHTKYSHDGRPGWTEDDVRRWHHDAGYDVAYITDHATFDGAERGIASNPGFAGEGTMLLQGLEAVDRGEHVNILSAGRRYRGLTTPDLKDVDDQALALASIIPATVPLLIETIPGHLDKVVAATNTNPVGVRAIELVDGSPRGLTQSARDRARIIRMADSLDLAPVSGSDNHGWGSAAPAWTLMRIPGWRGMPTDSLSTIIEQALRLGRRRATRVVERRVAQSNSPAALVVAGPAIALRMFTTLSADERVMWLLWTWGIVIAVGIVRGSRARRSRAAMPA